MRTPRWARLFVAIFNTAVAFGLAGLGTVSVDVGRRAGGELHLPHAWGAAIASLIALAAVAFERPVLGWVATGYLLWVSLLSGAAMAHSVIYLALALSLMPVLPRPSRSVGAGVLVSIATAAVIGVLRSYLGLRLP